MALIVSRWRMLLAIAVIGSALAFAHRGYWVPASVIGALLVLRAACRVAGELAATRRMLRGQPAAGRHRKPLVRAYTCSRCGTPGETTWPSEEAAAAGRALGLDLVCDACTVAALRLVATPRL